MVEIEEVSDDEGTNSDVDSDNKEEENAAPKKKATPKKKNASTVEKKQDPMEACWAECGILAQWGFVIRVDFS